MNRLARTMTVLATVLGLGVAAPGAAAQAFAAAGSSSARGAATADRTGPAVLHAPPALAPLLENVGGWHAEPIGICLVSVYRAGEYVYQGCPYDDNGGGVQYRWFYDTIFRNYTYPADPIYRRNLANLLEVRIRPLPDATAFRVTMNTMTDPSRLGLTLALGSSATPQQAPHGANTVMPAERFVTVHGEVGDVTDASSGRTLAEKPAVNVDLKRRQIEIRVPHSAYDPTGRHAVRVALAAGLWDRSADSYLVPQAVADATHPGGAVSGQAHPSAFFDSAFRFGEPFEAPYRDALQKKAIAAGDLSPFHADVDFGKLAARADDDTGIPRTGYLTRVYASHFEPAQGRRLPDDPGGPPAGSGTQQGGPQYGTGAGSTGRPSMQFGWPCRDNCVPDLPGRMQRYMVYLPPASAPAAGYPSLVWTNGYALRPGDDVAEHNDLAHVFGNRPGNPTVVIDVDARGNDEWFYGASGASVFEAIADARRHYRLDPQRTTMSGFSSGAYGANKLALQFPDVFNKAFICDGLDTAPSFPTINGLADEGPTDSFTAHEKGSKLSALLPSRRNQPVMEWAGANDDFIPYDITRERAQAYAAGDYDYEFVSWGGASSEHLVMCKGGLWAMAANWLGDTPRAVDPHHVTYVRDPFMDDPAYGLVGDHAYWVSGITTREHELGTIDVVSHGRGESDPPVAPVQASAGSERGTFSPVNPYLREFRHRPEAAKGQASDALDIVASNISAITVDPHRAGITCNAALHVASDGPLTVHLLGCPTKSLPAAGSADPAYPREPAPNAFGDDKQPGPFVGAPFPKECCADVPAPPLDGLPPLRFPPNAPTPGEAGNYETPPLGQAPAADGRPEHREKR